jgi:hypothetical protein
MTVQQAMCDDDLEGILVVAFTVTPVSRDRTLPFVQSRGRSPQQHAARKQSRTPVRRRTNGLVRLGRVASLQRIKRDFGRDIGPRGMKP